MKIAYLIAAHTDSTHLQRLVDALNIPGKTDFYIHLDRRADIHQFSSLAVKESTTIIPQRYLVQWGGFSQCRYQMALINACIESNKEYDRVFFLSGQDYPLWSNRRIIEYLEKNKDKELIAGMDITTCTDPPNFKQKLTLYHFFRDIPVKSGRIKRIFSGASRIIMRILPFRKNDFVTDGERRLNVYQGSSWWCITMDCLRYVYEHISENIQSYFKTCFAPDEMMIQTIVFNSSYKEKAILYEGKYPGLVWLTPLHHIEYKGNIKVFTEDNYEEIKAEDKMFFRKATTEKSAKLLDLIDDYRTEQSE